MGNKTLKRLVPFGHNELRILLALKRKIQKNLKIEFCACRAVLFRGKGNNTEI